MAMAKVFISRKSCKTCENIGKPMKNISPSLPIGWIGGLAWLILAPRPYVSHPLLYVYIPLNCVQYTSN